jgi:hypothetical protein
MTRSGKYFSWFPGELYCIKNFFLFLVNRISGVMIGGFESRLGQTKDYKIDICCFSAKHEAFRRKSKDRLASKQDNVSI